MCSSDLAIAGVLAMKPRNLVLDEPLSALDPEGRSLVERALSQLVTPTGALLMVCHDMDAAGRIASRMVVLDQGAVALEGPCAQVFSHAEKLRRLGLGLPAPLAFAQQSRCAVRSTRTHRKSQRQPASTRRLSLPLSNSL